MDEDQVEIHIPLGAETTVLYNTTITNPDNFLVVNIPIADSFTMSGEACGFVPYTNIIICGDNNSYVFYTPYLNTMIRVGSYRGN